MTIKKVSVGRSKFDTRFDWKLQWDEELTSDFGDQVSEETLRSRTGEVTVTAFERGWKISGRSKVQHTTYPSIDGRFTAEIRRCDSTKPRCMVKHSPSAYVSDKHEREFCHDLGHEDKIKKLADQLFKTY